MKRSFRVYIVEHATGNLTGYLMRRSTGFFRSNPIVAFGESEEALLEELEGLVLMRQAEGEEISDYLWEEEFHVRTVKVEVNPLNVVGKQYVVGRDQIPFRLSYAWSKLGKEDDPRGFRLMLPRYDWWLVLEDLDTAPTILRHTLSSALLGDEAKWIFNFREHQSEYVIDWAPPKIDRSEVQWRFEVVHNDNEVMEAVAENLVDRANRLPRLIGPSTAELSPDEVLLLPNTSILLVGPSGAGKTTFVQRMAAAAAKRKKETGYAPTIWATSADRIVAGMAYLGQWEQRCLDIVEALRHERAFLFVDRLEDFIASRSGGSSVADLMSGAIQDGSVQVIAECTEDVLEVCRQRAPSLLSRFKIVRVPPVPSAEIPALMRGWLERKRTPWTLHPESYRRVVRHLEAFDPQGAFPGKAFGFLEWLVQEFGDAKGTKTPRDLTLAFSKRTGLPESILSDAVVAGRDELAAQLSERVIGQDNACRSAARVLTRLKAGLNDPGKPCGSLFFVGPTGVGKTELAKQLARVMFGSTDRMIRLDMSEFMAPGSSRRLLATGRGVESLAVQVRRQPLSLVLLDEIEKANHEVFDLLLGVLGEGRMSDDRGAFVDFSMTVIVMTSNVGAGGGASPGFGSGDGHDSASYLAAVRKQFRPEFFNRIDEIVPFATLSMADIERIVDLTLDEVRNREGFARRDLQLEVTDEIRRKLAELGWDPEKGARPLKRVIEERIVTPIAVEIARNPQLSGETFRFDSL